MTIIGTSVLLTRLLLSSAPEPAERAAQFSRAAALHQAGDLSGAVALYEELLRQLPEATQVRSNLGAAYAGLGRFEDAITEYRRALATEEHPAIRQNLALALQKAGRLREAADEAARSLEAQPKDRHVALLLADILLSMGEDSRIVEILAPLSTADPSDKAVAYVLGTALLNLGRADEAERIMDPLFREDSPEAHILIGTIHAKRRSWNEALAEFDKARAAKPDLPLVNYLVGDALMRGKSDWAGAAAAFETELERNPNHYEANVLLGTLLLEGGQLEAALPRLERAARLRGDDLSVKYPLGAAYLAAGRLGEARSLLEAMSKAAPNHQATQFKLAVLYTRLADQARANASQLQKEADSRAFAGGMDIVTDVLERLATPGVEPTH